MDLQTIIALAVIGLTVVLLIRHYVRAWSKGHCGESSCPTCQVMKRIQSLKNRS